MLANSWARTAGLLAHIYDNCYIMCHCTTLQNRPHHHLKLQIQTNSQWGSHPAPTQCRKGLWTCVSFVTEPSWPSFQQRDEWFTFSGYLSELLKGAGQWFPRELMCQHIQYPLLSPHTSNQLRTMLHSCSKALSPIQTSMEFKLSPFLVMHQRFHTQNRDMYTSKCNQLTPWGTLSILPRIQPLNSCNLEEQTFCIHQ